MATAIEGDLAASGARLAPIPSFDRVAAPPAGYVRALFVPSAFDESEDRREVLVPAGMTLAEIFAELGIPIDADGYRIVVDDEILGTDASVDTWSAITPAKRVLIRQVPAGPLAGWIQAFATQIGSTVGTFLGNTAFSAGAPASLAAGIGNYSNIAAQAGVYAGLAYASLALFRSFAPPGPPALQANSPTIQGIRNQPDPWGPFWRIFGKRRVWPRLATSTYLTVKGSTNHFIAVFDLGMGPLRISEMKIGDTDIANFPDLQVEVRNGFTGEAPLTLAADKATTEQLNRQLVGRNGKTGYQIVQCAPDTASAKLTIAYPSGLVRFVPKSIFFPNGTQPQLIIFQIQYKSAAGTSGAWVNIPKDEYVPHGKGILTHEAGFFQVIGAENPNVFVDQVPFGAFFTDVDIAFPFVESDWEVRIQAVTAGPDVYGGSYDDSELHTDASLVQLVSFGVGDIVTQDGVAMIAVDIRSTDSLAGVLDTFNVVAEALLPYYETGSGWLTPGPGDIDDPDFLNAGRIPAWQFAEILAGNASPEPQPYSQIDAERLEFWAGFTEDPAGDGSSPKMNCDCIFDFFGTVREALARVAATGQAVPTMRDGLFSVAVDYDKSAETDAALITPHNAQRLSWRGSIVFPDHPHAIRCAFKNELAGYTDDELPVFAEGYNADGSGGKIAATRYADFDHTRFGVTHPDQVTQFGRRFLLEGLHRTEGLVVRGDIETVGLEKGDPVEVSVDVPLIGIQTAELVSVQSSGGNVTGITISEPVTFTDGKSYGITWRTKKGALRYSEQVDNPATGGPDVTTAVLTFTTPFPDTALNAPTDGDRPFAFGELGLETQRWIIKAIRPMNDLRSELELMPLAPEIFAGLGKAIPSHPTPITIPIGWRPDPPKIAAVELIGSTVTLLVRPGEVTGALPSHIEVQIRKITAAQGGDGSQGEVVHDETEWHTLPAVPAVGEARISFGPVIPGEIFRFRARAIAAGPFSEGTVSLWSETEEWIAPGGTRRLLASDVEIVGLHVVGYAGRNLEVEGGDWELAWDIAVEDLFPDALNDESAQRAIENEIAERLEGYRFRVVDPAAGGAAVRTYEIASRLQRSYRYGIPENRADNGTPRRELLFGVSAIVDGVAGPEALLLVRNPAGPAPTFERVVDAGGIVELSLGLSNTRDSDYAGVAVWASKTQGFQPGDATLVHEGTARSRTDHLRIPLEPSTTYYFRVAQFDAFSRDPATLNLSEELQYRTKGVQTPNLEVATFANLIPDPNNQIAYDKGLRAGDRVDTGLWWERDVVGVNGADFAWQYSESTLPPVTRLAIVFVASQGAFDRNPRVAGPADAVACRPGDEFVLEVDYRMVFGTADDIKVGFFFLDETGAALSVDLSEWIEPASADTWFSTEWSATAPAGASAVRGGVQVRKNGGFAALFSNFQLRRKIDSVVIGEAVINDAHIADVKAGKITTDSLAVGVAIDVYDEQTPTPEHRIQLGDLGPNPEDYGLRIWDQKGRLKFDADGLGLGSVVRNRIAGAVNLIQGPGFEDLELDEYYSDVGGSGGTWEIVDNEANAYAGNKYLRFTATDWTTGADAYFVFNSPLGFSDPRGHVLCVEGDRFFLGGYAKEIDNSIFNTGAKLYFGIRFLDADKDPVGSDVEAVATLNSSPPGAWEFLGDGSDMSGVRATAPADAHYVVPYIRIDPAGDTGDIEWWVDELNFGRQSDARDLGHGSVTAYGEAKEKNFHSKDVPQLSASDTSPMYFQIDPNLEYTITPQERDDVQTSDGATPSGVVLFFLWFNRIGIRNKATSTTAFVISSCDLELEAQLEGSGATHPLAQQIIDMPDLETSIAVDSIENQSPVFATWFFPIQAQYPGPGGADLDLRLVLNVAFTELLGGNTVDLTVEAQGSWSMVYLRR